MLRLLRQMRASVDSFDVLFGLLPLVSAYATFIAWANLIVRAIRGEEAEDDWRVTVASAAHIAIRAVVAATEVRESVALRQAVGETKVAVSDTRQLVHEIAVDAAERDNRAEERQDQLYKVTLAMAWVAGLTLLAAIVTLVVAIIGS